MKVLADQLDALMRKVNKLEAENADTVYSGIFDRSSDMMRNRSAILRDLQIVFDPGSMDEIKKQVYRAIPRAMIRSVHPDTAIIRFETSDNDIELITRDLKRHPGILEVDRV